jgi:ankyrin repeat protein
MLETKKGKNGAPPATIISQVDIDGWTLLHLHVAVCSGSSGVIPLLLQAAANPHAQSIAATNELMCGEGV